MAKNKNNNNNNNNEVGGRWNDDDGARVVERQQRRRFCWDDKNDVYDAYDDDDDDDDDDGKEQEEEEDSVGVGVGVARILEGAAWGRRRHRTKDMQEKDEGRLEVRVVEVAGVAVRRRDRKVEREHQQNAKMENDIFEMLRDDSQPLVTHKRLFIVNKPVNPDDPTDSRTKPVLQHWLESITSDTNETLIYHFPRSLF